MEKELVNAVLAMDDATTISKKFVVFIDTQVDFMISTARLYVNGAEHIIGLLNRFAYNLNASTTAGVLFTYDTHHAATYDSTEESKQFHLHCEYGKPGWENVINSTIIDENIPVYELIKGVFNMWEEDNVKIKADVGSPVALDHIPTELEREEFFTQLKANGIDTIVIVGVAADFCVKWAADGFIARGFNVEIPRDLTAGIINQIDEVVENDFNGKAVKVV